MNIVENPTKADHDFEVLKMTIFDLIVCSPLPQDKIGAQVNRYFPAGTTNGWQLETEGNKAPVACHVGDGCVHFMFSC